MSVPQRVPPSQAHQPGVEAVNGHHPQHTDDVALNVGLTVVRQVHVDAVDGNGHCARRGEGGSALGREGDLREAC